MVIVKEFYVSKKTNVAESIKPRIEKKFDLGWVTDDIDFIYYSSSMTEKPIVLKHALGL